MMCAKSTPKTEIQKCIKFTPKTEIQKCMCSKICTDQELIQSKKKKIYFFPPIYDCSQPAILHLEPVSSRTRSQKQSPSGLCF